MMSETDRSQSIIHLIEKALRFEGEDKCLVLTPPESSEEPLPQEAFDFVDKAFQENAQRGSLPELGAEYVNRVRDLIRSAEGNRFCVIPSFRTPRLSYAERESAPEKVEAVEDLRHRFGDTNLSTIVMLTVLDALSEKGKAAFILPVDFFSSKTAKSFRESTLKKSYPELIIQPNSHPFGDALHPYFVAYAVVFSNPMTDSEKTSLTRFFSIPGADEVEWDEVADDFDRLLQQGGGETNFGYVLRQRLDPAEPWNYESMHPGLQREIEDAEKIGQVKPLSDSFEVLRGAGLLNMEEQQVEYGGSIPVIQARDIRPDGAIHHEDTRLKLRERDVDKKESFLREGDLCIREIWRPKANLISGKVDKAILPAVAGTNVIVLRPRTETTEEDLMVVHQYLQSEVATRYFRAKGAGRHFLAPSDVQELPIPEADDSLRSALRSLTDAVSRFDEWKQEAQEAARSLFDFPSAEDGKMHVLTTGRRTRQRRQAAEQVDKLSHRVQTQFPHPIAYRWRTVAASKPNLQGYRNVLGCAEVTLCYLALVAVKMAQIAEKEIGYLEDMGERIVSEGRGVNMGDWIAILREVRESGAFQDLPDDTPFYDVTSFMREGSDADEAIDRLKNRRDNHSHEWKPQDNKPTEEDFDQAKSDLRALLSAAEFSTEYPLRHVERTETDTLEGTVTYWFRDVMGDHPLVPTEKETIEDRRLEAGSLYLVDRFDEPHLLRPLLHRKRCPECGAWSTFYLDSYEGGETCQMKSLERSHKTTESLYSAFQKIGFLP